LEAFLSYHGSWTFIVAFVFDFVFLK